MMKSANGDIKLSDLEAFQQFVEYLSLEFPRPESDEEPTIGSQISMVEAIESILASSEKKFEISKRLVEVILDGYDEKLLSEWDSGPTTLAWLAVHPQLSNAAPLLVPMMTGVPVYLLHHVPKSAGTTVNKLLYKRGVFCHFPVSGVEEMISNFGTTAFNNLYSEYDASDKSDQRFYVGGHYNLPGAIIRNRLDDSVQGITICRSPEAIIRSALRYTWTKLSNETPEAVIQLETRGRDELTHVRQRIEDHDVSIYGLACEILEDILNSGSFQSQYAKPLTQYYTGHGVETTADLRDFFRKYSEIRPVIDLNKDADLLQRELKIDVRGQRHNASFFDDQTFSDMIAKQPRISQIIRDFVGGDDSVFDVIRDYHEERSK